MKLEGKTAVVTGASSGMGRSIVELFTKEGANVIAMARREDRLRELAELCRNHPGTVLPYMGDVSKEKAVNAAIDLAVSEFGRLDILVNNAGIMDDMSPIGEVENDSIGRIFEVNVYGPMFSTRKAVNTFKAQGSGGNIINVASVGAMRTCAGAVYCASKAALVSLTKNTAFMYMKDEIRCNAIAPGGISTEIAASMGMPNMVGYSRAKLVHGLAPAPGTPEQIASAALFLASDDSSYINGDVLVVDGGWTAG